jgi:peptidoglycan biosynthesis protein MviN/MurJ (putative lipid II flippase)
MLVNVTAAYILSQYMGNSGVALALVCGAAVNVTILVFIFVRRYGALRTTEILTTIVKVMAAAGIMTIVCWLVMKWTGIETMANGMDKIALTLMTVGLGIIVFILSCMLLRIRELGEMAGMLRGRVRSQ